MSGARVANRRAYRARHGAPHDWAGDAIAAVAGVVTLAAVLALGFAVSALHAHRSAAAGYPPPAYACVPPANPLPYYYAPGRHGRRHRVYWLQPGWAPVKDKIGACYP